MVDITLEQAQPSVSSTAIVHVSPRNVFIVLVTLSILLILISFVGVVILAPYSGSPYTGDPSLATPTSLAKIILRFDVVTEGNIPSWFSGTLLFISAALAGIIAADARRRGDRYRWHWLALAVLFVLFSLDEVAYLHEGVSNFMGRNSIGFMEIGWIIPGAIFVLIAGLAFAPFILNLPSRTRLLFIIAGALFLTGALGLEVVESLLLGDWDFQATPVLISNHLQELFELLGVSVFIYALLSHIKAHMSPVRLMVD